MKPKIKIIRIITGSYQVNTYLVFCTSTGEGVIIDPGGDMEKILAHVHENSVIVKYILNTHGHADHILANRELKKSLKVPVAMHKDDSTFFGRAESKDISEKELGLYTSSEADLLLDHGTRLQVGRFEILVIHTPGHTPGSVCFLIDGNLFTGDTLFVGDVGRTDLTGGSFHTLLKSIKEKILVLPDNTTIWPGHDYGETPNSTLSWERKENPYITDFILAEE